MWYGGGMAVPTFAEKLATRLASIILSVPVWRWGLITLDNISRWDTAGSLHRFAGFTNSYWFVPASLVLGFSILALAAKSEIANAIRGSSIALTGHAGQELS